MVRYKFGKNFWELCSFMNKWQKQPHRQFTQEKIHQYVPGTPEYKCLQAAITKIYERFTNIPITIKNANFCSKDLQYQRMPHNKRCRISEMSTGNGRHLDLCEKNAKRMRQEWTATPMKDRIDICTKCADILTNENRHALNASIMLGQSKTYRQAEEDTCRTINNLRNCAEILAKLDGECKGSEDKRGYVMRSSGGFIAALTPYNWTSQAVTLAFAPAMMGNCIVWVPSRRSALASYEIYKSFLQAGLPKGVISFVPMNSAYFLYKITTMETLAGLSFAGRHSEYIWLANNISKYMDRPFSFSHMKGPTHNKNFHFVHESADVEQVAEATIQAAFDYNGQRGDSCERLYVPKSLWYDVQAALVAGMAKLKVGDVCDCDTCISAVIDRKAYKDIVRQLKHAHMNENCKILHGGYHSSTYGYFVEPTLVQCKTPCEGFMNRQIEGPLLSVYVYENDKMDEVLKFAGSAENFTVAGSVFTDTDGTACYISKSLRKGAANIYMNKPCIGNMDGECDAMPGMNREILSDKSSLLKFW